MRQWWVVPGELGGFSELRSVAIPDPGPGEVLVAVAATTINRGELIGRPRLVSTNPNARPAPSGIEFAGTVSVVGVDVDGWSVGDRVMGRGSACHADHVVVSERALIAVPAGLSLVDAAAIPNVFVTAHDAIVTAARFEPGESVLVTAGSSGVGTAAIQIARYLGASKVIATTTSPKKAPALLQLGASDVIDTNGDDWSTAVRDLTGGVNVVIDQVGGELARPCLAAMATGGRFVTVGRNGGNEATIDLDRVALKRLSILGVTFRTRTPKEALACSERFAEDLLAGFDDGSLRPVVDTTFALENLPAAHEYMASDRQVGKIVIVT